MESRIDILNELTALSPAIAAIQNHNVFTVPAGYFDRLAESIVMNVTADTGKLFSAITQTTPPAVPAGYFDSLADTILHKIKAQETAAVELKELSPLLHSIPKNNLFTVPQGYFESLSENVLSKVAVEDNAAELKELSPMLYSIQNENVFTVPQGYFESLSENVLSKVAVEGNAAAELKELSPMLYSIQNENVFTVPKGYFESLSENVLSKVAVEDNAAAELKELSPMLYAIQNENIFTVPRGYFESLPAAILNQVQASPAKLVTMKSRRTFSVIKYAVAAIFTGAMALGVYKFIAGSESNRIIPVVANVPDYKTINKTIKNVDEELAKVSDDDIIKYLQANGSDVDAALVANTMDEKELPTQDDYLTDDKALDKYLDNVDIKELNN